MSEVIKITEDTNPITIEDASGQAIDLSPKEHEEEIPLDSLEEKPKQEFSNELPEGIVGTQEAVSAEVPLFMQEHLKQEKELEDFKTKWNKQLAPYLEAVKSDPRQQKKVDMLIRGLFEVEQNHMAMRTMRAFDEFERNLEDTRLKRQIAEMSLATDKDVNIQEWFINIRQDEALRSDKDRNPQEHAANEFRETTEGRLRGTARVLGEDWKDLMHSEALLEGQKRQAEIDSHLKALEGIITGNQEVLQKELESVGGSLQEFFNKSELLDPSGHVISAGDKNFMALVELMMRSSNALKQLPEEEVAA